MKERLLSILVCPKCKAELSIRKTSVADDGDIHDGVLSCSNCPAEYPIVRGIPRFVDLENYADSFGLQWNTFRTEQLDSQNGSTISRDRFYSITNWDKEWLKGKLVLDAGCGAGRFMDIVSADGGEVIGIDLSNAVEASRDNLAGREGVHFVQASIYELPFRDSYFEACYCIGVVQHTPDPFKTIRSVAEKARNGGRIAYFIYERKNWTLWYSKYLLRPITTRMKQETLLTVIKILMPFMFVASEILFRVPILAKYFMFILPVSNYVGTNTGTAPNLTIRERYQWAIMDTFDMMAPAFDQPLTEEEARAELASVGVDQVERTGGVGLCLSAVK